MFALRVIAANFVTTGSFFLPKPQYLSEKLTLLSSAPWRFYTISFIINMLNFWHAKCFIYYKIGKDRLKDHITNETYKAVYCIKAGSENLT